MRRSPIGCPPPTAILAAFLVCTYPAALLAAEPDAPQPVKYERVATLGFGGATIASFGIQGSGYTLVPLPTGDPAQTGAAVSMAFNTSPSLDQYRIVALDTNGKVHEPIESNGASGGQPSVVTFVVKFALSPDNVDALIIQRRKS